MKGSCHCGALRWSFNGVPDTATACNCTVCRRYGALWIYGWEGETVTTTGPSAVYSRDTMIGFNFCPTCGCLAHYHVLKTDDQGRRKMAVNLRMIEDPDTVAQLPIRHFDGLDSFTDLPRDRRHVADMWF